MSLQYVIDGYNILNHHLFTSQLNKKTEDPKLTLFEFIKINKLCGNPKNKITVVFDGYPDLSKEIADLSDIGVIFSRRETADERIKKITHDCGNPKTTIVVSDDKEIKFFVKSLGAKALSVEEFIVREERFRKNKEDELKRELNYTQIHRLNQELRKIWLK